MRKSVLIIVLLVVTMIACNTEQSKYGEGGRNACQYIREKLTEQVDNIQNVEVIGEDSMLSPYLLSLGTVEIYSRHSDFYGKEITIEQWHTFTDSMMTLGMDVTHTWLMDKNYNDSLRQLSKYHGLWRKAYLVEVTMKSGKNLNYRVCMNEDGITPYITQDEFMKKREDFMKALSE